MGDLTSLSNLSEEEEDGDTGEDTSDLSHLSASMHDDVHPSPPSPTPTIPNVPTPPDPSSSFCSPPHKRPRPSPSLPPSSPSPPLDPGAPLTLDIGGRLFRTTAQTLLSCPPSFFTAALSHPTFRTHAALFVDRDPTQFRHVLNFLRDGRVPRSLTAGELEELLQESRFYALTALTDALDKAIADLGRRRAARQERVSAPLHAYHRTMSHPLNGAGGAAVMGSVSAAEQLRFDAEF